jgi:signal transduction histidine kinase
VHGDQVMLKWRAHPEGVRLFIDPEQMTQLLLNLAINACEAMEYAGELTLTAEQGADSASQQLTVQDNGPGISPKVRGELFKPFITTKKSGTGLGLPMVARIAHAHSGRVDVGESPSGGALFRVMMYPQGECSGSRTPADNGQAHSELSEEASAEALTAV